MQSKLAGKEDKSISQPLTKEPIVLWRKYRVCLFAEYDDDNLEAMNQIDALANWLEIETSVPYYYTTDLEDARKVKQKALEIWKKAGMEEYTPAIFMEETLKNIDYPEGYLSESEYIVE